MVELRESSWLDLLARKKCDYYSEEGSEKDRGRQQGWTEAGGLSGGGRCDVMLKIAAAVERRDAYRTPQPERDISDMPLRCVAERCSGDYGAAGCHPLIATHRTRGPSGSGVTPSSPHAWERCC